jgi:hypothetical protein
MTLLLLFPHSGSALGSAIVDKVARMLRVRLVEAGGNRVETFTTNTSPSRATVLAMIDDFAELVYVRTGDLDALTCVRAEGIRLGAATLIAQRVAIEIELSYAPEEIGETAAAAIAVRREEQTADLDALVAQAEQCRSEGDGDGGESHGRTDPAWRFPYSPVLRF